MIATSAWRLTSAESKVAKRPWYLRASSPITGRPFEVAGNAIHVPSVGYGEVVVLDLQ
jgi:hypothetical protein